ncbi:trimeric intracellular cation channel family protein [Arsenicicoccus piscis]|uniref:Glycine transporter domain-containing protein n=1 Tax=Arsenicicoccus piscis TaxID=673954 RepID=A0ABQ6HM50_9MICO|nr:trimeric intracellular cation channel family protein [Arsenicicoccus piscis]MCH8628893.1 trimeric intracellular cation channel family protein [Arsenicicoccus piscis]GMA19495.1 hypothetical protein GCM10025862_15160 [Arsenicicoccus piscis]
MANAFGSLQLALDLLGVFVFAVSGALVGVRKDLDVFGVLCLALATSLAGGIVRDVLLDATPVGVSDWRLVACALVAGLIGFRWSHHVERLSRPIKTLDAAGLALFSVSGAIKALTFGANGMEAVILGLITAVGGGVIRDLLSGIVPEVLRRELYAVPAVVGGILVVLAAETGTLGTLTASGAVAVVFCYRLLAIVRHWHAPHAPPPPVGSAAARRRARWDRATRRARIVRRASAVRRSRQSSGRGSAAGPVQQDPSTPGAPPQPRPQEGRPS